MAQDTANQRLHAIVTGSVQGVGFRYWVRQQAERLGLTGTATNCGDGSVVVIAEGPTSALTSLQEALDSGRTPGSVKAVEAKLVPATGEFHHFHGR